MNKKYIIIIEIVLIVLLIIFFFPKRNNVWNDSFTASVAKQYKNMDCTCIGFIGIELDHSKSDTQVQLCYGLPISCTYTCKKEINNQWQNISCKDLVN